MGGRCFDHVSIFGEFGRLLLNQTRFYGAQNTRLVMFIETGRQIPQSERPEAGRLHCLLRADSHLEPSVEGRRVFKY